MLWPWEKKVSPPTPAFNDLPAFNYKGNSFLFYFYMQLLYFPPLS